MADPGATQAATAGGPLALSAEEQGAYEALVAREPTVPAGTVPDAALKDALKAFKAEKQAFLGGLSGEGRAHIKRLEKAAKAKAGKAAKAAKAAQAARDGPAPPPTAEERAAKKAAQEAKRAAQAAKQAEREAAEQKRASLAGARRHRKGYEQLCGWLGIEVAYEEDAGEGLFEVTLPKWLVEREEFLERTDLDDGKCLLEADEVSGMLLEALAELAALYFGEDHQVEVLLDNMVERAQSATELCRKPGLPPWYKHMSYPLSPDEVAASLE